MWFINFPRVKESSLLVHQVEKPNFRIPSSTQGKHLYTGPGKDFQTDINTIAAWGAKTISQAVLCSLGIKCLPSLAKGLF